MLSKLTNIPTRYLIGLVLAACAVMIGVTVTARAADKGGPKAAPAAAASDVAPSWTGLGFDVHGSLATGVADFGAPVNISMDGQMGGASLFYNHRLGTALVVGFDVGYDRVWGDLHSFGIDYAWTIGVRAGLLPTQNTLVYSRAQYLKAQGSGGHVDGYGVGLGIETRLAGTPASVALEYMHNWMDKDVFGPSIDVTADQVTARLKFNFDRPIPNLFADR